MATSVTGRPLSAIQGAAAISRQKRPPFLRQGHPADGQRHGPWGEAIALLKRRKPALVIARQSLGPREREPCVGVVRLQSRCLSTPLRGLRVLVSVAVHLGERQKYCQQPAR